MVRRNSWFPHQPKSATNPAIISGTIHIGCLKRLVMVRQFERRSRDRRGFVNINAKYFGAKFCAAGAGIAHHSRRLAAIARTNPS
jgi:hypothetical protein